MDQTQTTTTQRIRLTADDLCTQTGGPPVLPPKPKILIQAPTPAAGVGLGCLSFLGVLFLLFSAFIGVLIFWLLVS